MCADENRARGHAPNVGEACTLDHRSKLIDRRSPCDACGVRCEVASQLIRELSRGNHVGDGQTPSALQHAKYEVEQNVGVPLPQVMQCLISASLRLWSLHVFPFISIRTIK